MTLIYMKENASYHLAYYWSHMCKSKCCLEYSSRCGGEATVLEILGVWNTIWLPLLPG